MAFACAWTSMFPPVGSGTKPSTAAPRLGINYVAASAKEATVGGVVIQQSLHALGIAGVVWNSARVLVDFIQQNPKRLAGLHVVELGAGTGAVGLAAALACSPQTMTLTDLPEVVERATQRNATQASTAHAPLKIMADQGRLVARDHCWGSPPPASIVGCDVVLCSDCLYEPSVFEKLVSTLCAITPRQVYFAYKQRHAERERAFFEAVSSWFDVTVWTTTTSSEDQLREPMSFLGEGIFICCLLPKRKSEEKAPEVEDA